MAAKQKSKSISATRNLVYKHPMLGLIPNGWEVKRFADVFEFLPTNSFSRDQMTYGGDKNSIYNIHYGDIHATFNEQILDFNKQIHQIPILIDSEIKLYNDALLKDGDLIIADASEDYEGVGECIEITGINKRKVLGGLHTICARDSHGKTIHGFRAYLLKHPKVFINLKKLATGSKVYGVSKGNVAELELVVPPVNEQQKIAHILSTWDKAIEKTEQLIAQKQQLKKALMQQLLSGKVRFKEFVKSKKMKKTKLGMIPEDWNVTSLSEACASFKSGFSITSKDINEYDDYHVYGGNGLRGYTNSFTHDGEFFLIGRQGALCGNIVKIKGKNYVSEHAIAGQANELNSNDFLAYKLEFINLNRLSESSAQPGLSVDKLLKLKISTPSLIEQQRISTLLSIVDYNITSLNHKHVQLIQQKKGLMQKLLTGQVRVNV
jgi:type I restriction enzyme S subunit